MNVEIHIIEGPLPRPVPWSPTGAGAVVCFEGVVRPLEKGRDLRALEYEVYEPMTSRELAKIAREVVAAAHGLLAMRVEHSRGTVGVGRCSFRLSVASAHRKEGLAAMDEFIGRMKHEAPIWKVPVWLERSSVVGIEVE